MTVISARWQSNMPFQGQQKWHIAMVSYGVILSGRLNYYITRWRHEVSEFWRAEIGEDVVEKASTQQKAGPPGLRLIKPGEREWHNADGHKSGGQYLAVLFGLQLPLTHTTLSNKVRGIFFLKKSSLVFHYSVNMYSACTCVYIHIYYMSIQQY